MDASAPLPLPAKGPADENFPVASRLIAPDKRAAVLAFYGFVRLADDVADDPDLPPAAKLARLDVLARALDRADAGVPQAVRLAAADARHGTGREQALVLLDAFRQDAVRDRYRSFAELLDYCARSAAPVGRFLLRLHGEGPRADDPSDALCAALQILNHLQDLVPDRERLDRIYLPLPWLERAGGVAAFFEPSAASRRRPVLDAILDRVDALLDEAACLPGRIAHRGLAAQAAVTLALARHLADRLRREDPVARRVALGRGEMARIGALALGRHAFRGCDPDPVVTRAVVARSHSSFRAGIAVLTGERRRAMHAVYAFCRVVDDIADGAAPIPEKLAALDGWRREIDRLGHLPRTPIGRELAEAVRRFDLDAAELHAILDGMAADAAERVRLPDDDALDLYCRRVAGAVGLLSVRVFGAPQARDFALCLGRTLQIVNILRDLDEDAAQERVYVPLSRLSAAGIPDGAARAIVQHPAFARIGEDLAREAREGFRAAEASLAGLDRRALKPAILMMEGYRLLFDRLCRRGFTSRSARPRLAMPDKLWLMGLGLRSVP